MYKNITQMREHQRRQLAHQKKMHEIRNRNKKKGKKKRKGKPQSQLMSRLNQKQYEIQQQNQKMLQRLLSIAAKKPSKRSRSYGATRRRPKKRTKHQGFREQQQLRIQRENQAMALRLIKMNPTMSNKKWRKIEHEQKRYANLRSKYNLGRRKLPPIQGGQQLYYQPCEGDEQYYNNGGYEIIEEEPYQLDKENYHNAMKKQMLGIYDQDEENKLDGWENEEPSKQSIEQAVDQKLYDQWKEKNSKIYQEKSEEQIMQEKMIIQKHQQENKIQAPPEVQTKEVVRQIEQNDDVIPEVKEEDDPQQNAHDVTDGEQIKIKQYIPSNMDNENEEQPNNQELE